MVLHLFVYQIKFDNCEHRNNRCCEKREQHQRKNDKTINNYIELT